ncbi:MAG: hypothetical protein ACNA8W_24200, partial [Bradymonadaceae bacterium]
MRSVSHSYVLVVLIGAVFCWGCNVDDTSYEETKTPPSPDVENDVSLPDEDRDAGRDIISEQDVDLSNEDGGTNEFDVEVDPGPPPQVTLVESPNELTNETSALFTFECDQEGCGFECALGEEDWGPCESSVEFEELDDGDHRFRVRATHDLTGTGEEVEHLWTVDTIAPVLTIVHNVAALTKEKTARFELSCDKGSCTFECAFDRGSFEACTTPKSYYLLSDGQHDFDARATDLAGNTSDTERITWVIDTVPPKTTFTQTPDDPTYFSSADFDFECDKAPCTFECSLNGVAFAACTPPVSYEGLSRTTHELIVRARDELGNTEQGAVFSWEVTTPWWLKAATGAEHSCGLADDGSLWCWGNNSGRRLGDGTTTTSNIPVRVGIDTGWTDVSAGPNNTCGINAGELWCWGAVFGQGAFDEELQMTRMGTGSTWKQVSNGFVHVCAIRGSGELWCWGGNNRGQ